MTLNTSKPPGPERSCPVRISLPKFLAMAAMVLQILLFADHIGASAVKTFGNVPSDARLGFMELCTGDGIELVSADGTPIGPEHDCPICDSAAVMGFDEPAQTLCPPVSFVWLANDFEKPRDHEAVVFRILRQQPIRAPPSGLTA